MVFYKDPVARHHFYNAISNTPKLLSRSNPCTTSDHLSDNGRYSHRYDFYHSKFLYDKSSYVVFATAPPVSVSIETWVYYNDKFLINGEDDTLSKIVLIYMNKIEIASEAMRPEGTNWMLSWIYFVNLSLRSISLLDYQ